MGLLLDLLLGGSNNKGNSLQIGDWVRIKSYGDEGEIIAIHGNLYEVEIEGCENDVETFTANELEKLY